MLHQNKAQRYMRRARWMIAFRDRYNPDHPYATVLREVSLSQSRAGGPALRLACAVWDLEYRLLFPKLDTLRQAEEHSFGRLLTSHRSTQRARHYHVWKGIEAFCPIRESRLGRQAQQILLPLGLEERNWLLPKTLWRLDKLATMRPELKDLVGQCAKLHPQFTAQLVLMVQALIDEADHYLQDGPWPLYRASNRAFLHVVHKNPWLGRIDAFQTALSGYLAATPPTP